MKLKRTAFVLSSIIAAFLITNVSFAYVIDYTWGNTTDKYYTCSSTFSDEGKNSFSYANITWNSVSGADIDIYRSSPDNSATDFNNNGANEVFKADAGAVGLMTTRRYLSGGYIVEFDIRVNTYYPWSNSADPNCYDVQNCATHEIGHVLFIMIPENKTDKTAKIS